MSGWSAVPPEHSTDNPWYRILKIVGYLLKSYRAVMRICFFQKASTNLFTHDIFSKRLPSYLINVMFEVINRVNWVMNEIRILQRCYDSAIAKSVKLESY
jgi:hypothetical protein